MTLSELIVYAIDRGLHLDTPIEIAAADGSWICDKPRLDVREDGTLIVCTKLDYEPLLVKVGEG